MSVLIAKHFQDEEAAYAGMEAHVWPDGPVCPHCGAVERIYALKCPHQAQQEAPGASCARPQEVRRTAASSSRCPSAPSSRTATFRCTSGFRRSTCLLVSKKGISSHQLHRTLRFSTSPLGSCAHRIREAMRVGGLGLPWAATAASWRSTRPIYGRASTHPKGRRRVQAPSITNSAHKNVILSLVERGGSVRSYHVAGSTVGEIIPIVNANVAKEAAGDDGRGAALQIPARQLRQP